jgi:hypothetical protein
MNGVMPGPLLLAIASAAKGTPSENGTLTHPSKNVTFSGNMIDIQPRVSHLEAKGGDGESEPHSETHKPKREGG